MQDLSAPDEKDMRLFVSRIPASTTKSKLMKYFSKFGVITDIYLSPKKNMITPRIARITTLDKDTYLKILNFKEHILKKDKRIIVEPILEGQELKEKYEEENSRKVSVHGIYGRPKKRV